MPTRRGRPAIDQPCGRCCAATGFRRDPGARAALRRREASAVSAPARAPFYRHRAEAPTRPRIRPLASAHRWTPDSLDFDHARARPSMVA